MVALAVAAAPRQLPICFRRLLFQISHKGSYARPSFEFELASSDRFSVRACAPARLCTSPMPHTDVRADCRRPIANAISFRIRNRTACDRLMPINRRNRSNPDTSSALKLVWTRFERRPSCVEPRRVQRFTTAAIRIALLQIFAPLLQQFVKKKHPCADHRKTRETDPRCILPVSRQATLSPSSA